MNYYNIVLLLFYVRDNLPQYINSLLIHVCSYGSLNLLNPDKVTRIILKL